MEYACARHAFVDDCADLRSFFPARAVMSCVVSVLRCECVALSVPCVFAVNVECAVGVVHLSCVL